MYSIEYLFHYWKFWIGWQFFFAIYSKPIKNGGAVPFLTYTHVNIIYMPVKKYNGSFFVVNLYKTFSILLYDIPVKSIKMYTLLKWV